MSLLLDALKKAAEQNAEKSGEAVAEQGSSDETLLSDQTITKFASETETTSQRDSETELRDQTASVNGLESETTGNHIRLDSSQLDSPETELDTQLDSPETEFDTQFNSRETELDTQFDSRETEFDTQLETEDADEHIVVADEPIAGSFNEDENLLLTDDDVTAFLGDDTLLLHEIDDSTKLPQIDAGSDTTSTQSSRPFDPLDEELSISLFDEDDTLTADEASKPDSATLSEEIELELEAQEESTRSLHLADISGKDNTAVEVGRSDKVDVTSSTQPEFNTQTGSETSTRTFALDNYDRTLRAPGSEDVSNVFAGLKSDTDIVMTPEYAKKMFRSKSSAQRVHNVKIYVGSMLAIFVIAAIFGVLELDQYTNDIDNSLRSLKRDPMPGLIKNTSADGTFTNVFAATPGSEVDAATLQLVKNAESQVDAKEVVAIELGVDKEIAIDESSEAQIDAVISVAAEVEAKPVKNKQAATKIATSVAKVSEGGSATSDRINITSSSKISEKDRLLREAYSAYQRGDDKTALVKYNAVLDFDPSNRNALLARAAIYIQHNRIPEAIRDYKTILIVNPKDSLAMSSMIAIAHYSPEQSETQLKLMIRDEPDSPYLNFALGNIFGAQNRWQEAQGQYFAALENNPSDPNYAYNLAVSLEHISKPKVAITYYERALNNFSKGLATFNRDIVDARLEILRQL